MYVLVFIIGCVVGYMICTGQILTELMNEINNLDVEIREIKEMKGEKDE